MKKLLLSIGTITATFAPIAAVVACGSKDEVIDQYIKVVSKDVSKREITNMTLFLHYKNTNPNRLINEIEHIKALKTDTEAYKITDETTLLIRSSTSNKTTTIKDLSAFDPKTITQNTEELNVFKELKDALI